MARQSFCLARVEEIPKESGFEVYDRGLVEVEAVEQTEGEREAEAWRLAVNEHHRLWP